MAKLINSAITHLWVQHPKFIDAVILEQFLEACARGIKVHLLGKGKHGVPEWNIYNPFRNLRVVSYLGVQIRRYKHLKLHANMIISDQKKDGHWFREY